MSRPLVQLVSAWVLLWAFVASALAGPVGVLLCRDASGETHIEWSSHPAPCGTSGGVQTRNEPALAATPSCEGNDCEARNCADEPLSLSRTAVAAPQTSRLDFDIAPAAPAIPLVLPAESPTDAAACRAAPSTTGPPREPARHIATTVLRL